MISKLFSPKKPQAAAPEGARLYAIGDIHGRLDLLDALMSKINEDAEDMLDSRLIFLGDYVDRGPESRAVVDRLLELKKTRPGTIFLKGNHEATLLKFLSQPEVTDDWLYWGGDETLKSYDIGRITTRTARDLSREFAENLPASHLEFFQGLELVREIGDYLFVHAGIAPGISMEEQSEDDLLWIRGRFHDMPAEERPEHVVVHGHHPVKNPHDSGWRINVDTGAVWSGKLTAVVLEGKSRRFLST